MSMMGKDIITVCSDGFLFAPVGPRLKRPDLSDSDDEDLFTTQEKGKLEKKKEAKKMAKKLTELLEKIKKRRSEEEEIQRIKEIQREESGLRKSPSLTRFFQEERFKKGSGAVKRPGEDYTEML